GDHLLGRHPLALAFGLALAVGVTAGGGDAEDLPPGLEAAARFVVLQPPVGAVEAGVDLRVDVAAVEARLGAGRLEARQIDARAHGVAGALWARSSETSSSSRWSVMKLTICSSLTRSTGAS